MKIRAKKSVRPNKAIKCLREKKYLELTQEFRSSFFLSTDRERESEQNLKIN